MRYLLLAVLFAVHPAAAQETGSEAEGRAQTLRKGVELHQAGKYEAAIKVYETLLKDDPNDAMALYEMAFSHMALKDYARCIDAAQRSSKLPSPAQVHAFGALASCQDDAGLVKDALLTFERGTQLFPKDPMLNFNYAITLIRQQSPGKARGYLRTAIENADRYASPYRAYASLLKNEGNRSAALFMNMRMLMLEGQPTPRSMEAARDVMDLVLTAARKDGDKRVDIPIVMSGDAAAIEGKEFDALNVSLAVARAATLDVAQTDGLTPADGVVGTLQAFFTIVDDLTEKKPNATIQERFVWKYAADSVMDLKEQEVLKPFLYHIAALARVDGAMQWLRANEADFRKLVGVLNKATQ